LEGSKRIAVNAERYAAASESSAMSPLVALIGSSARRSISALRSLSEALRSVKSLVLALRVTGKFKVPITLAVSQKLIAGGEEKENEPMTIREPVVQLQQHTHTTIPRWKASVSPINRRTSPAA
jgi:hypothetical protein